MDGKVLAGAARQRPEPGTSAAPTHPRGAREDVPAKRNHRLAPARGIVLGVGISLVLWFVIGLVVARVFF